MSNLLENIPLIVFFLALSAVFIIFLVGVFFTITARKDSQKIEKGKKILLSSLYGLFIVLLMTLVFFSVNYLLKRAYSPKPPLVLGKLPSSPAVNYPPPPQFIKIGRYYLNGPWPLGDNSIITTSLLYAILCKKDDKYDIIYIEDVGKIEAAIDLSKKEQYDCWLKNCSQEAENLYIALSQSYSDSEKHSPEEKKKIQQDLENQTNPSCRASIPSL